MKKHHPDNERVKRKYFIFLKEAKRQALETWRGFLQGRADDGAKVVPMRKAHSA